jgi:hypothetical protein
LVKNSELQYSQVDVSDWGTIALRVGMNGGLLADKLLVDKLLIGNLLDDGC